MPGTEAIVRCTWNLWLSVSWPSIGRYLSLGGGASRGVSHGQFLVAVYWVTVIAVFPFVDLQNLLRAAAVEAF